MSGKNSVNANKTAETVLGVTFGKRKGDKETWWLNKKVHESIKRKNSKKAWNKKEMKKVKRYTKKRRVRQRRRLHL